jgi:DNA-binding GntR family transcriptional regulator
MIRPQTPPNAERPVKVIASHEEILAYVEAKDKPNATATAKAKCGGSSLRSE